MSFSVQAGCVLGGEAVARFFEPLPAPLASCDSSDREATPM